MNDHDGPMANRQREQKRSSMSGIERFLPPRRRSAVNRFATYGVDAPVPQKSFQGCYRAIYLARVSDKPGNVSMTEMLPVKIIVLPFLIIIRKLPPP
jgi:hypothetical protein